MSINKDIEKIESLRKTIQDAEKTIQSAKATLLKLEGGNNTPAKDFSNESDEENIFYGTFDGQIMIGDDGKQYPVPANYASKSKVVEGDMLKLTIDNGNFLYKQVGPIERKNLIGIAGQDESGNYFVMAEGTPYKILLASVTYFKISPGDEVVITIPAEGRTTWAAIENVLQKDDKHSTYHTDEDSSAEPLEFIEDEDEGDSSEEKTKKNDVINEWMSDIEEIKKEIQEEKVKTKQ